MFHRDLFLSCNQWRYFNSPNLINALDLLECGLLSGAVGKSKQQAGAFYPKLSCSLVPWVQRLGETMGQASTVGIRSHRMRSVCITAG